MAGRRRVLVAPGALFLGVLIAAGSSGAQAGAFCRDPATEADVAAVSRHTLPPERLAVLQQRLDDPATAEAAGCTATALFCVGRQVALAGLDQAYGMLGAAQPDVAGARTVLQSAKAHGSPWQLLATLGDVEAALARQDGDPALYREAAEHLQLALNAMAEPPRCSAFPEKDATAEDVRRIRKRAEEAVLLSPRFEVTRTRSGECGGIFLGTLRGIGVETTPVPITFAFGQATFTPDGRKAAEALLQCLQEKTLPAITLTGHTDDKGADAYNLRLSAERLDAVAAFLKQGGYTGALHLIPMGKREPFQPDDPTQHSAEELDQMNRRVELRETGP